METIGGLTQYYEIVSFNGQLDHGEEILEGITVNDARHGRINNGTLWNIRVYAIPSALLLLRRWKVSNSSTPGNWVWECDFADVMTNRLNYVDQKVSQKKLIHCPK